LWGGGGVQGKKEEGGRVRGPKKDKAGSRAPGKALSRGVFAQNPRKKIKPPGLAPGTQKWSV